MSSLASQMVESEAQHMLQMKAQQPDASPQQ